MATNAKISYKKLIQETPFEEDDELYNLREKVIGKMMKSSKCRKLHMRKKMKVKIPSIEGIFRRKAKLVNVAWKKVLKRLKESKSHFCDLFAGNYVFMQVIPTALPLKEEKCCKVHEVHHYLSSGGDQPTTV